MTDVTDDLMTDDWESVTDKESPEIDQLATRILPRNNIQRLRQPSPL